MVAVSTTRTGCPREVDQRNQAAGPQRTRRSRIFAPVMRVDGRAAGDQPPGEHDRAADHRDQRRHAGDDAEPERRTGDHGMQQRVAVDHQQDVAHRVHGSGDAQHDRGRPQGRPDKAGRRPGRNGRLGLGYRAAVVVEAPARVGAGNAVSGTTRAAGASASARNRGARRSTGSRAAAADSPAKQRLPASHPTADRTRPAPATVPTAPPGTADTTCAACRAHSSACHIPNRPGSPDQPNQWCHTAPCAPSSVTTGRPARAQASMPPSTLAAS